MPIKRAALFAAIAVNALLLLGACASQPAAPVVAARTPPVVDALPGVGRSAPIVVAPNPPPVANAPLANAPAPGVAPAPVVSGEPPPVLAAPTVDAPPGVVGTAIGRELDDKDRAVAIAAQQDAIASGQRKSWKGGRGTYGFIVPGVEAAGCRDYTHRIFINGRPQEAKGQGCRVGDAWRATS